MPINRDIKYINRDFNSFRNTLIDFSKVYFPNTYTDFSPSSPGMMFIEQSAYVGDVLSFYIDNQIQENFIQYSRNVDNIFNIAYMKGYKPKVTGLSTAILDIFQLVPSKQVNGEFLPDYDYSLFIPQNTPVKSEVGVDFIIEDSIDFSVSNSLDTTEVSIAQIDNGDPTFFLLKKQRKAFSGEIKTKTFSFGEFQEFPTVLINEPNISHILDVVDEEGNVWYEVDSLAQDVIFNDIKNTNINSPNTFEDQDTPYILQTKKVQRRFTTRFLNTNSLQIQFGSGNPQDNDEEFLPNPINVGLGLPFGTSKLTTAYSPSNFIFSNTYGIAPLNTSLTFRYVVGGGVQANVSSNNINAISTQNVRFLKPNLNNSTADFVFDSLLVNNEEAADGGSDGDTIQEIRLNALSNFSSQLRSVTPDDYLVRALSMPSKFGVISKAFASKPVNTLSTNSLDLFILTQDSNQHLQSVSNTLKNNLKTYLNRYKMIGDFISIKDAFVVNIGINFEIINLPNFNSNEVILGCINELQTYFDINRWQINQPIILRELFVLLDGVEGVQTVKDIKIHNKTGEIQGYSKFSYDIESATQNGIIYPSIDPMIFEVKFPNEDIKGKQVNLF